MNKKIERRGRPLGSGNKVRTILGMRVSYEEYNIVKEGLVKLKPKFKTNKKSYYILLVIASLKLF